VTSHRTIHDYIPLAQQQSADQFAQRYNHPFLFGREVLEEEFRFSTLVTEEPSVEPRNADGSKTTGTGATGELKIRHWVIAVKKPATSAGQDRIFLGRAESNDICVPHKTVSKLHSYFQRDLDNANKWFVVDTGSANGTKHNGMRIPPRAKVVLVDGDTIVFGRCVFQFFTARSLHERLLSLAEGAESRQR
jgi:hypothetical protein